MTEAEKERNRDHCKTLHGVMERMAVMPKVEPLPTMTTFPDDIMTKAIEKAAKG